MRLPRISRAWEQWSLARRLAVASHCATVLCGLLMAVVSLGMTRGILSGPAGSRPGGTTGLSVGVAVVAAGSMVFVGAVLWWIRRLVIRQLLQPLSGITAHVATLSLGRLTPAPRSSSTLEIRSLEEHLRNLTGALGRVTATVGAVASGDLLSAVAPVSPDDELGRTVHRLSESLGSMVSDLHAQLAALRETAGCVMERSGEITADRREMSAIHDSLEAIARRLTENTRVISRNIDDQGTHASGAFEAVQRLARELPRIAEDTEGLVRQAQNVDEVIDEGRQVVRRTDEGMRQIHSSIGTTGDTIAELTQHAQTIGTILEVIDQIAHRTRLLALNAAIEAARAGEAGRGFSVVAEEVRQLSEQTARSAEDIQRLIEGVQKCAEQAARNMEKSAAVVDEGLVRAAGLTQAFDKVARVAESVVDTAFDINSVITKQMAELRSVLEAMEAYSCVTDEINRAGQAQAGAAGEIAGALECLTYGSDHQDQRASDLADAGARVLSLCDRLESVLANFRLPAP